VRESARKGQDNIMRILITLLCIVSSAGIFQWTAADAADHSEVQAEIKLAGSKSLAHIIDLSGAQDGMAPQKTDLPRTISDGTAEDDLGKQNRSRTN
jgi:hypothetical protein